MELYNTLVRFFVDGGFFMAPIGLTLAVGLAVALERYLYIGRTRRSNKKLWEQLLPLLKAGDYKQAYALTKKSGAGIGRILGYGLSRSKTARRRDDIETAMEEGLMELVPKLEKRTHYLAVFANIATLLGLLGTILGLIDAFTAVSAADPAKKADMLSGSISVAMNTTAFGLIAAIPLLLVYTYLQSRTTEVVDSLEMATVKLLNILTEHKKEAA